MKEIKKIIVPIDFLQHADQIVEYAVYIGKNFDAHLKFAHIIEPPNNFGSYEYPSLGTFTTEMLEHAERKMQQFVQKYREIFPSCEGKILQGNVVDSIIKYANDENADLIVIGTHGRKGLERMWLGSVAERVIKNASCPTLTCNPYKESR